MRGVLRALPPLLAPLAFVAGCTADGGPLTALQPPEAPTSSTRSDEPRPRRTANGPVGITLMPVIGAPVEAVRPLSRTFREKAERSGVAVLPAATPGVAHSLKGYLSATALATSTEISYVWDVFDPTGHRLYRISGVERTAQTAADPWQAVSPELMARIAERTLADYLAWLGAGV